MENFKKLNSEIANGVINFSGAMSRSLIMVNHEKGVVYNVIAKCRVSDAFTITKCLAKAILAIEKERHITNSTVSAIESGKRVNSPLSSALGCQSVYLVDKDGKIIENVGLSVRGKYKLNGKPVVLRDLFRFSKSQKLYQLVVEQGKEWSDTDVIDALKHWCNATIEQMDWLEKADLALEKAANSTEKEQTADEEKKDEEKNAKKAA